MLPSFESKQINWEVDFEVDRLWWLHILLCQGSRIFSSVQRFTSLCDVETWQTFRKQAVELLFDHFVPWKFNMSPSEKSRSLSGLSRPFVHLRMPRRDCSYSRHYYAGSMRHSVIVVVYPSDFILDLVWCFVRGLESDYMHQWRSTSSVWRDTLCSTTLDKVSPADVSAR